MIQDSGDTEPVAEDPAEDPVAVTTPDSETALPEDVETTNSAAPLAQPEEEPVMVLSLAGFWMFPVPESAGGNSSGRISTTVSSTVSTWQLGVETLHWIGIPLTDVEYRT